MTEQEEYQEFWEACGLHHYPDCECIRIKGICWGISAETYGKNGNWHFVLPSITLDNLFKYAVPKVYEMGLSYYWKVLSIWYEALMKHKENPTQALYQALRKVLVKEQQ